MASSGKPLGERQLAIPPEIKIYTPERDARGTNDHVGQGLLDHSYLPRHSRLKTYDSTQDFWAIVYDSTSMPDKVRGACGEIFSICKHIFFSFYRHK